MKNKYDVIVIGSGFGGSVSSYHLAKSGAKVLLLERGPWRDTNPVHAMGIEKRSPLPAGRHFYTHILNRFSSPWLPKSGVTVNKHGLFDIHYDRDMSIVCSSGVGGGSHVYSAMNIRPDVEGYWNNHVDEINSDMMDPHYQWMINKMGARPPTLVDNIPNFTGKRYKDSPQFVADENVQQPAMSIDMSTNPENFSDNSFFGCKSGSKATLDQIFLSPAISAGLEIKALQECLGIYRVDSPAATSYRLEVVDHQTKRHTYYQADRVIIAAGTLNTQRLLFRSRDNGGLSGMPALGRNFGGNGDFPAYWAMNEKGANFSIGTPSHGRFELRDYPSCPNLTEYGLNGVDGIPFIGGTVRKRLKRDLVLVGMGADRADGEFTWQNGRLRIRYSQHNNPIIGTIAKAFEEITHRSGKKVWFSRKRLLTVHPLGGARMASNQNEGVVNEYGEVYGNQGLFVADASALPASPGSPPSMTIAAWACHVSQTISSNK